MSRSIKLLVPNMPSAEQLLPRLKQIDEARHYTNFGPQVASLEVELRDIVKARRIVTTTNCTVALTLALRELTDWRPRSYVLTPSLTFPATILAIVEAGYDPLFADVDPDTWCMTPATAIAAMQEHDDKDVAAVMPVAAFGCSVEHTAEWGELGAPVIVDAAGAVGNQKVSAYFDAACFSLHATKALGAGEGGFIALGNHAAPDNLDARIRRRTNFGFDNGEVVSLGGNSKLSEYHAAVALTNLDDWTETRAQMMARNHAYIRGIAMQHVPFLKLQRRSEAGVYTLMPVLLPPTADVAKVAARLMEAGIETRRWYYPPSHLQEMWRGSPVTGEMDVTEDIANRLLGLPMHRGLSAADIEYVCTTLGAILK